jgi:hypothetical protein
MLKRISTLMIRLLLVCIWALLFINPARAAIEITSFTAEWDGDEVRVDWETASELDIAGFYLQRAEALTGSFGRITTFIPAEGDPFSGFYYLYFDDDVTSGRDYWYLLEIVDTDQESESYGPVAALSSTLTPSPTNQGGTTQTPQPTQSLAPTNTQPITTQPVVPTATRTPAQSAPTATRGAGTAYPAPSTATPGAAQPLTTQQTVQPLATLPSTTLTIVPTDVLTTSVSLTGTATLIPLPDITLTFPPGGIQIQERGTTTPTQAVARASSGSTSPWNPTGGVLLISTIVLIWLLLGAWFYLAFRRIE